MSEETEFRLQSTKACLGQSAEWLAKGESIRDGLFLMTVLVANVHSLVRSIEKDNEKEKVE